MPQIIKFKLRGIELSDLVRLVCEVYGYQDKIPAAEAGEFLTDNPQEAQQKILEWRGQGWEYRGDMGQAAGNAGATHQHVLQYIQPTLKPNPQTPEKFARQIMNREFSALLVNIRRTKAARDAEAAEAAKPGIGADMEE